MSAAASNPGARALLTPAWLPRLFPWANAASESLPWSRLARLSLFQVSVGLALVMLNGTLNRVMIVELGVPAWLVGTMVALPLVFAPLRALIGFRSDHHRSAIGWKRVPYLWLGTMLQFGGFAIMPFALLLLTGDGNAPVWVARAPRRCPSCSSARVCTPCRPPGSRSRPTWRRPSAGRRSSRCCTSRCSWACSSRRSRSGACSPTTDTFG